MTDTRQSLQAIQDIRKIMERSTRFISLSGLSGIAAGCCALAGAWIAWGKINCWQYGNCSFGRISKDDSRGLITDLFLVALGTFIAAFATSFLFTYMRSRKSGMPIWGATTLRLFWNMAIPLTVGAAFMLKIVALEQYELIAPGCLLFYGLALVNASKYTLGEVRYLGYGQLVLGVINLWMVGYGLYFWAAGFGVLHIVYGAIMWWRYERGTKVQEV